MAKISRQVRVDHSPAQMYELINDVSAYANYIPLCSASVVHEKYDDALTATLTMAKGNVSFSFTTMNTMQRNRSITMDLVRGPFRILKGIWRFMPCESNGCEVSLEFEFEFSNKFLSLVFGPMFKQVCDSMVGSFIKQAAMRYGSAR